MERREAIQFISVLLGGTLVGTSSLLSGCSGAGDSTADPHDVAFLDEVADTILPPTDSPGAKAAGAGAFIALMVRDCYSPAEQEIFNKGISSINEEASKFHGRPFMQLNAAQRHELIVKIDNEQKEYMKHRKDDEPVHYFRMMKELTLLGYFTSEAGITKAKRYMPVPGKYIGCVPYTKGDKAIA